jgi:hypothetical protein
MRIQGGTTDGVLWLHRWTLVAVVHSAPPAGKVGQAREAAMARLHAAQEQGRRDRKGTGGGRGVR